MFANPALYESLIVRAERLADEVGALNKILGQELIDFVAASGVDKERWAREADALARAWGIRD
jgi:hypothetical protein